MLSSARLGPTSIHSHSFAAHLYLHLYQEYSTATRRQEIVAALVAHCGAPSGREVDWALAVLGEVAGVEARVEWEGRRGALRGQLEIGRAHV